MLGIADRTANFARRSAKDSRLAATSSLPDGIESFRRRWRNGDLLARPVRSRSDKHFPVEWILRQAYRRFQRRAGMHDGSDRGRDLSAPTYTSNPRLLRTRCTATRHDLLDDASCRATTSARSCRQERRASRWATGCRSAWQPKGIYWDFDNDPTTDADLVAWWNGSQWVKNYDSGFAPVTAAELTAWGRTKRVERQVRRIPAMPSIHRRCAEPRHQLHPEGGRWHPGRQDHGPHHPDRRRRPDGAGLGRHHAAGLVRLPTTPTTPTEPTTPTPTVPVVSSSSGGGGGCAIGNDGRFDPTLPAMLFAGLGFLGWRRYKAGK